MPVTASTLVPNAPARAWTRWSPNRKAGALRPSSVRVPGDPLNGWTRQAAALTDTVSIEQGGVDRTGAGLQLIEMDQPPQTAQVARVVDDSLDAQRPPVLQILLDAGVPVEGVDVDLGAVGDDLGLELTGRRSTAALPTPEDQLDPLRAADVEVVGDQGLEEPASVAGCIEHQRARGLHLAHRQLPPIAGGAVVLSERQRQDRPPTVGEHRDHAGAEPVADRLQPNRIAARGEPVGQLGEPDPGLGGLALGPLVAVDPDLHRIREIGTHLHKRRPEILVPEIKVITGDTPIGLGEGEPHSLTGT